MAKAPYLYHAVCRTRHSWFDVLRHSGPQYNLGQCPLWWRLCRCLVIEFDFDARVLQGVAQVTMNCGRCSHEELILKRTHNLFGCYSAQHSFNQGAIGMAPRGL